jgi:hypothetical protein
MDLIYTSAVLTLIAAAGSDPSYGLPGVSNARKMKYRDTSIGKVCVSFTPGDVYNAVADSLWFTRGWTFQEGYVSRRRLYFTESGILFICSESAEDEHFYRDPDSPYGFELEGTLDSRAVGITDDGSYGLIEIMQLLEQYMRRQLSYENDVSNAIVGVLNYHRQKNPSIGTVCGLPYQKSVAGLDVICMNWTHDRPATRRLGYPSWSPFGWIGSIKFSPILYQLRPSEEDAAGISCHLRDECVDWSHPESSQYLQITVNVHRLPVVNLIRSDLEDLDGVLSEHPKTVLVIPQLDTKVDYGGRNYYMDIKWDVIPPDHYDSTRVTCAVIHNHDLKFRWLMILQDYGTHYERIGIASFDDPSPENVMSASGFDELASTTNGLPTLRPGHKRKFFWSRSWAAWHLDLLLQTRKVTIALG